MSDPHTQSDRTQARPAWQGYAVAVLAVLAALMLRLLLNPLLGDGAPFALLFLAVMATSFIAGIGPALLAIALSIFAAAMKLSPVYASFDIQDWRSQIAAGSFTVLSAAMAVLYEAQRRHRLRAEKSERTSLEIDRELRESEARHRLLASMTSDYSFVYELREDGARLVSITDNFSRITGYEPEDIQTGEQYMRLIHPDDRRGVVEMGRKIRDNESHSMDLRLVAKDGSLRWLRVHASPVWDEREQRVVRMIGAGSDITRAKTAEIQQKFLIQATAMLSESLDYESTLQQVAQAAVPDLADWCAVDIVEEDGEVRRLAVAHIDPEKVRVAIEFQKKYPPHREAPTGLYHVLRTGEPELHPEITQEMIDAANLNEEQLEFLKVLDLKSSILMPIVARGRTLGALTIVWAESNRRYTADDLDLAQELARRAGIAIDNARLHREAIREVEERRRAEAEVTRLNQELERRVEERTGELRAALEDLEGFCYSVSHDLRAPMRSIAGNSNILLEDYADKLDAAGVASLKRLAAAATKMGDLIDDLLAFSRLGRTQLHRRTFDLSELAESIMATLRNPLGGPAAAIKIEPGMEAAGDPVLIGIALQNLIENAIKYADAARPAEIEVGKVQGAPNTFFVRDNGIGFDMQYVDKIFQPFERLHRESEYSGTGIGLANVRRIISRHGGRVWAESEQGNGSTFYFTLPDAAATAAAERIPEPSIPGYVG